MTKAVCIHAHFYQPPRENPWLEEVELQDSAYPFHDWNERITAECYAPNTASRLLNPEGNIVEIINTYSRISFNFGPTLLSWMERREPDIYEAILDADRQSRERFSGHGSALAQVYNHIIMPLANRRDKETQIVWGIADFRERFGREPEGMWLAETAVDLETLELLAKHNIRFTILAPHQAGRVRKSGESDWEDVSGGRINPRRSYRCPLPSGAAIDLFFYDGPIARDVAFGDVLSDGIRFADRLVDTFDENGEDAQLVHIATDGETYGHHHRHGDMALSYCLHHIKNSGKAEITIYGDFLEKNPPRWEVEIIEDTSWSCVHGIERWRADCGCNSGGHAEWNQSWRAPLRNAIDWLRDALIPIYEEHSAELLRDPWRARDEYIDIIRDRSDEKTEAFLAEQTKSSLSADDKRKALTLLEMQRHSLLMQTSCGWFFDEISGIETVQIMQYASRCLQLARMISGLDFEPSLMKILELAPSNVPELKDGATVYNQHVKPAVLDLERVGGHYAVLSLLDPDGRGETAYCYHVEEKSFERLVAGRQAFCFGELVIRSDMTRETLEIRFVALHLGEHNVIASVDSPKSDNERAEEENAFRDTFTAGDISQTLELIEKYYPGQRYSLWHLFRDDQRRVLDRLFAVSLKEIDFMFRQIYQLHYPLIQVMDDMDVPLPKELATMTDFVCNADLRVALEEREPNIEQIGRALAQAKQHGAAIDRVTLGYIANRQINALTDNIENDPTNIGYLEMLDGLLNACLEINLPLNLWKAQNVFYNMHRAQPDRPARQIEKSPRIKELVETIGRHLQVEMEK